MSSTPTTATQDPARTAPAAPAAAPEPEDIEYPEGHWIAQSVAHGVAVRQAAAALDLHFAERENVLVAMELVVYYQRGQAAAKLQPDVQVVLGVPRAVKRGSYKVWEEGKAPDFVLEVASPSTTHNDAQHKAREYARIGVREYWRLDPDGALMSSPLEGYVASGDRYGLVEPVAGAGRHLWSEVLGLDLRSERQAGATVLVFGDPATGEEFDGGLAAADQRRRAAEERASAAEERVRALEERLQSLATDRPPPEREP
ncbi:MAG: Uma2 family endonuclease [Bryobacterales bacterium]|nr:Uma2 family endonuclease [Bryobacterales bacterium]